MNRLMKGLTALSAVIGITLVATGWSPIQEGGKKKPAAQVEAKKINTKGRTEKLTALKKAIPTLKTPLTEAIALAEKELSGKVYAAELQIDKNEKPLIQIGLLLGDKLATATVDPETKKVTLAEPKKAKDGAPVGGDGAAGDGEGGGSSGGQPGDGEGGGSSGG